MCSACASSRIWSRCDFSVLLVPLVPLVLFALLVPPFASDELPASVLLPLSLDALVLALAVLVRLSTALLWSFS